MSQQKKQTLPRRRNFISHPQKFTFSVLNCDETESWEQIKKWDFLPHVIWGFRTICRPLGDHTMFANEVKNNCNSSRCGFWVSGKRASNTLSPTLAHAPCNWLLLISSRFFNFHNSTILCQFSKSTTIAIMYIGGQ